ncbi:MAG: glycosyltransferase [Cytophagales bacterium]|nr:glycosyltransferase [Cytophaga sp.]
MNIIILNTNSFGGNYEYSRCLAKAYAENNRVAACTVLIPSNALQKENNIFKKVLLSDHSPFKNSLFRKCYFLYRSIVNPIRTYLFLKSQPSSIVLFNDYEQISSWLWAPLFRPLKKIHTFAVILHDPDRDRYLPLTFLSVYTMKKVMSIMDAALYHEVLPEKIYYSFDLPKIKIPHGIYHHDTSDEALLNQLYIQKGSAKLIGMLGNIRDEKNYSMVIESLQHLPGHMLLIAGSASGSGVPVAAYKKQIAQLQLSDRVIWIEKRLTDDELQSVIKASDVIVLYYKNSFTSQSGIVNLIAPHKKDLIVSDAPSALREIVLSFGIGKVAALTNNAFVEAIQSSYSEAGNGKEDQWQSYMDYASWSNHVNIVLSSIGKLHATSKRSAV